MDNRELIQAAELLKQNCKEHFNPDGKCECVFGKGDCNCCDIYAPTDWEIPKLRRFTDEQIALAKALKELGATTVTRGLNGTRFYNDSITIATVRAYFNGVKFNKPIPIDDIIQDEEA